MRRRRGGFTLIELLVSIVVVAVVTVPLGAALVAFLKHTDTTTERLERSQAVHLVSAYFATDVASMGVRKWDAPQAGGVTPFGLTQSVQVAGSGAVDSCGVQGSIVVRLAWDEFSGQDGSTLVSASYVEREVGGVRELHRVECRGGEVASDVTLSRQLAASPTVRCAMHGGAVDEGCRSTPVPHQVELTLSIREGDDKSYDVSFSGQRRQT